MMHMRKAVLFTLLCLLPISSSRVAALPAINNNNTSLIAAAAAVSYWLCSSYKYHTPLKWNWNKINPEDTQFPQDFLWGASSSSGQIEGGCTNSNWAVWEAFKSSEEEFEQAGDACDFWNNYPQFIQLLKDAGLNSFRMSIEWSKVQPRKPSEDDDGFNQDALAHYQKICKAFKDAGINLVVTLHHYTEPLWFSDTGYAYAQDKIKSGHLQEGLGGFSTIDNLDYFAQYAERVFEELHQYVTLWATFNNPTSYAAKAYHSRDLPPGKKDMQLWQDTLKNMLEAHVRAYKNIKKKAQQLHAASSVGILHNVFHLEPAQPWNPLDRLAVHMGNKLMGDPVYEFFTTGRFYNWIPKKVYVDHTNLDAPNSLDWIGVNNYSHGWMHNFKPTRCPGELPADNRRYTVYPEGMYRAIVEVSNKIATPKDIPMYVMENGISISQETADKYNQEHGTSLTAEDIRRTFFEQYVYAISQARQDGHDVRGYLPWSLVDPYEWGTYKKKYGLYEKDQHTDQYKLRPGTAPIFAAIKREQGFAQGLCPANTCLIL